MANIFSFLNKIVVVSGKRYNICEGRDENMDKELKEFLESMKQEINTKIDLLQSEIKGIKAELGQTKKELKEDISDLKKGQKELKSDIKNSETILTIISNATAQDIKEIRDDIDILRTRFNTDEIRINATEDKIRKLQQLREA